MTLPLLFAVFVFGLMIGSFLNVCISRLPEGESVVSPRSRCPKCRTEIAWYDNIPVLSYVLLGGQCRKCQAPISALYPLVELTTAITFTIQAMVHGDDPGLLAIRLIFTAMLIVLFGTDLQTMRLPNVITYPGIVIGLVASLVLPSPPDVLTSAIGAAIGAAIPWLIRYAWFKSTGVEAMGLGDVKMLAMIGAFLGWQQVWVVLFISSLAGAIVGIILLRVQGRSMATRIPFGTFLAIAAFVASVAGEPLVRWYLNLYK